MSRKIKQIGNKAERQQACEEDKEEEQDEMILASGIIYSERSKLSKVFPLALRGSAIQSKAPLTLVPSVVLKRCY